MLDGVEDVFKGDFVAKAWVNALVVVVEKVLRAISGRDAAFGPYLGPIVGRNTRAIRVQSGFIVSRRGPYRSDMLSNSGGSVGKRFDGVSRWCSSRKGVDQEVARGR